jgi:co-chaperonin GroES (HSP10)
MDISVHYVLVKKVEEPKTEGFQAVEIQDSFVYKGKIVRLPGMPVHMSNRQIAVGDVVLFAKYSPDTVEIEIEGEKQKFVKIIDLLAVL